MSWTKQPLGGAPAPPPVRQPYAAPQPQQLNNQQQNMYQNYQPANTVPGNTQQYWQAPQAPTHLNQQYGQVYQQDYAHNANQFYQQQPYNQSYQYNNPNEYQQNYYTNQPVQQNFGHKANPGDTWEDNWDWGWDESSKQNPKTNPMQQHQQPPSQQQIFNNANIVEESFATTDSWNWSMDENKEKETAMRKIANAPVSSIPNTGVDNRIEETAKMPADAQPAEEVKTLSDREVVKERLPNLAIGKRLHLDNLTPQWSIESQMSQESSEGPQTQSEGTYRSEDQSRNSSKSSPGPNTDNSNFNSAQTGLDEFPQNSEWSHSDNPKSMETAQNRSHNENREELATSMQAMHINTINTTESLEFPNSQESLQQPPSIPSPLNFPPPSQSSNPPPLSIVNMPPPPPVSAESVHPTIMQSLPPPPLTSAMNLSAPLPLPQPSSAVTQSSVNPVPSSSSHPSNVPSTASTNPFKHAGPFSHKSSKPTNATPLPAFPMQMSSANLVSSVNKSQHRMAVGFEANLETTPDNSERPDQPQMSLFRSMPVSQQVPDNLEIAPQNDRNEYLQTAHLSSSDFGENTDFSRSAPPPNFRRMVVGQQESEYSQNLNISGDEPPPGLARMVPGQQTEAENMYNQSNDDYMDRQIDGQTMENARPYRQADGQQTSDTYSQPPAARTSERRPIGLDRMVPGESSNIEFTSYQSSSYASSNEHRVVTGEDHAFSMPIDAGPTDIREQNVDGSDYSEHASHNPIIPTQFTVPDEQQREVIMEGENLQDLSVISSTELTYSREQVLTSADMKDVGLDRKTGLSDALELPATSSRRQSLNRNTSGDDSERDRTYKSSPRRDKDKHKSSRDRERDREREKDGRYSRDDRKYDRDERRSVKDDRRDDRRDRDRRDRERNRDKERSRRDRDESSDARKHRRANRADTRHRYETEDTDYYSDRDRDRRRTREGSYTSRPPRAEEGGRLGRHGTVERERRRARREDAERTYRDIDPSRKLGGRRARDDDRRRGERYSPLRPDSREGPTDDDAADAHRRSRRHRADPYYDGYGGAALYGDPYMVQRQYQYYEHLRRTDPAAYMRVYQQLMAGQAPQAPYHQMHQLYAEGYGGAGFEARAEERGSVHSGRSSTTGLKGNDTDLNTDASLNLHLEESTVRSERMTPFRFSTAHIKGSVASRDVVVVRPSYPVDGRPATVQLLSLAAALAHDPQAQELDAYPGPLVKGVTHKKSVMEYCASRARASLREAPADPVGYVLVWELLALLLRQNGVVVGTDIAELLMKNTKEYEHAGASAKAALRNEESRHGSSLSGEGRTPSPEQLSAANSETTPQGSVGSPAQTATDEKAALDKLREYLIYGNRQEAIEWAMACGLWGHALQLALFGERRARAAVAARFLAALPRSDPLHTLYASLAAARPPAATCAADEKWGDWRPHAAIVLSNTSAKPEQDKRTLTQLGDSLSSRGLLFSAQFCYLSAGVEVGAHPAAPLRPPGAAPAIPRLALLLADPRATSLARLAPNRAIFATEIYEYAQSLSQDYVMTQLQAYKLVLAARLADAGRYERALAYAEQAARAVTRAPRLYAPALVARLADLADRLKYHDPALAEDPPLAEEAGDSAEPSPRHHQWLDDVKGVALALAEESASQASQHETPQHQPNGYYAQQQYGWTEQVQPQYQPQALSAYPAPAQEAPDYGAQHYAPPPPEPQQEAPAPLLDWPSTEEHHAQTYADPYWQQDAGYGYEAEEGARPNITMPGAPAATAAGYPDYDDDRPPSADAAERDTDSPRVAAAARGEGSRQERAAGREAKRGGGGWLGGILTKLSLRPPNQMILPDDKNPTVSAFPRVPTLL